MTECSPHLGTNLSSDERHRRVLTGPPTDADSPLMPEVSSQTLAEQSTTLHGELISLSIRFATNHGALGGGTRTVLCEHGSEGSKKGRVGALCQVFAPGAGAEPREKMASAS